MVFFQDRTGVSVTPAMLGFADASVLTGSVADAFRRRQDLANVTPIVSDFTGFVGYPVTKADLQLMFGEQAAKLEDWQKATEELQVRAREAGLSLFGPDAMRELASKQDFLDQLVKAHNIIFVACHADKAVITIPGQKPIEVSPADIAALNLVNKPFVFLRVCESSPGDNSRFADAFLKAGAIGVCVNTGTIKAAEANLHVFAFISGLHQARSIDGALRSMTVEQKVMSALYTLKEQGTNWATCGVKPAKKLSENVLNALCLKEVISRHSTSGHGLRSGRDGSHEASEASTQAAGDDLGNP